MNSLVNETKYYGYKHWTLEAVPRCFYVGKGRKNRPYARTQRNHKWRAIVKRFGIRVDVCCGPVTNEEACQWEISSIREEKTFSRDHAHDSNDIGCNFTTGGDGGRVSGWHHTEETREKLRQKMQQRLKNGWTHTPEVRQVIGQASKTRIRSDETRMKNRIAALRDNRSLETLKKIARALSKVTIRQAPDGSEVIFASLTEAARSVSGSKSKLCVAIKQGLPFKGYMWRYASAKV